MSVTASAGGATTTYALSQPGAAAGDTGRSGGGDAGGTPVPGPVDGQRHGGQLGAAVPGTGCDFCRPAAVQREWVRREPAVRWC